MGELHLSEDAASDRIRTARVALQFPAIFAMVADGRLHLAAVRLLAPYLTPESADELLAAAAHKSKAGIVDLLAARFPRPDVLALVQEPAAAAESIAASGGGPSVLSVPERIEGESGPVSGEHAPGHVGQRALVRPLSADSVAVQFTMARATHEKLKRVRELLGHELPAADIAHVFDRALDALLTRLKKRKFAATTQPRQRAQRTRANPRYIPAHVMRAVWERDGGQCTFESEDGRRCASRHRIEFDHAQEVARGGEATVENLRLRCRAHNQFAAEQTFGAGFMREKREAARAASAGASGTRTNRVPPSHCAPRPSSRSSEALDPETSVVPWLIRLGYRISDAHRAAAHCGEMPGATMEQRVKAALRYFPLRGQTVKHT